MNARREQQRRADRPAGWYPDPLAEDRRVRYWDGRGWTDEVASRSEPGAGAAPTDPSPKASETKPKRGRKVLTVSAVTFLVAGTLIVYALAQGQPLREVKVGSEGLGVGFYSSESAELSSADIEERQSAVEERVADLETRAQNVADSAPSSAAVDLSGTWTGDNALNYDIQQFDSQVVIQERSPYGITGYGSGTVSRSQVEFGFQAIDGSTGVASLQLVDERTLQGTFFNATYQSTVPVTMRR